MKTIVTMASLLAVMTLAACGKKEETKPVEAAPVAAPTVPASAPTTPVEPAKQEEAKK